MRVLHLVKSTLQSFRQPQEAAASDLRPLPPHSNKTTSNTSSVHATPPGEFPDTGPKPSTCPVITFHLSKILTLIGVILVLRALFVDKVRPFYSREHYILHVLRLKVAAE